MSRIACLVLPEPALQALLRAEPDLVSAPVAVTPLPAPSRRTSAGPSPAPSSRPTGTPPLAARVVSVSAEAARQGARPGMTVAQARARVPELVARAADPGAIAAARAALVDAALGLSPRVEPAGDAVYLEVGDLGRLYPTDREVALTLRARAAGLGLEVGVGVAGSRGMARLAAWTSLDAQDGAGFCVVPRGAEAAFAAPLPVEVLALPGDDERGLGEELETERARAEALESLRRWGVRRCGELARLPAKEVALRLGASGSALHRLASGRCDRPLAPRAPADEIEEAVELDFALVDLEALAFVLRGLLDRGLARLAARHLACAGMWLRLRREDGGHDVREVPLAAPTSEAPSLLQLARLSVERRPPDAPIVGAAIAFRAACAPRAQLDLFRPAGPAPARLSTTVARLQALVEEGARHEDDAANGARVGSPRPVDTHREEAITVAPFAPSTAAGIGRDAAPDASRGAPSECGVLALRRFRPELEVEVMLDAGATPRALAGDGISCHVVVAAGPFRVSGEWWERGGFARDYWDVHASDGALYRLYRDAAGRWFIGGCYD